MCTACVLLLLLVVGIAIGLSYPWVAARFSPRPSPLPPVAASAPPEVLLEPPPPPLIAGGAPFVAKAAAGPPLVACHIRRIVFRDGRIEDRHSYCGGPVDEEWFKETPLGAMVIKDTTHWVP